MKHLKTKLSAAIVMLLISAMMLTGVSFAWYTLSTNPEVKGITATAVANENLEIALDKSYENGAAIDTASANEKAGGVQGSTTSNYYTWGNLVDVSSLLSSEELRPAAYDSTINANGLYTAKYGTDGRISGTSALTENEYVSGKEGVQKLTFTDDVGAASETQYALKVVYWLRTNKAGNITLTTATDAARGADEKDAFRSGDGSYISTAHYGTNPTDYPTNALKVAFKVTPDGGSSSWVADTAISYGTLADNKVPLSATIVSNAVANTAYKVEMYVYLDGKVVTNAMAEEAISDIAVNVQFANSAITSSTAGAMKY